MLVLKISIIYDIVSRKDMQCVVQVEHLKVELANIIIDKFF